VSDSASPGGAAAAADDPELAALIAAALDARTRAYAPYSRFPVGAAVLCESGRGFAGSNVENATFPLTVCAERVAINTAVAAGEKGIRRLVVVTDTSPPASPCGACRQVIWEFGRDCEVVYAGLGAERVSRSIRELLPAGFEGGFLRK
jgi:cytidine deaminase